MSERHRHIGAGILVCALLLAGAGLAIYDFKGGFTPNVEVTARIASVGDSLQSGNIVTYRDVIVGKVVDFRPASGGGADVRLRLDKQQRAVPSAVTAYAAPADLFGATEIVLVPPKFESGTPLRTGDRISADDSVAVAGLQTALSDAYDLITAVKPAELSAALTALGRAFDGRGAELHDLIRQANTTLRELAPTVPRLTSAINDLATVTEQLARDAPDLLHTVRDLLVPARAITRSEKNIEALLDVAPRAADRATRMTEASDDDIIAMVTESQPLLAALASPAGRAGHLVTDARDVVSTLNRVAPDGRAHLDAIITGINLSGVVQTYLGKPSVVLATTADPQLYTAADCPRYPGAAGPNCGAAPASTAGATRTSVAPEHTVQPSSTATPPSAAASAAPDDALVRDVARRLADLPPTAAAPGLGALLGPLLRGATR